MKLSDKVVSLEIAQKLYDMGVRIETEFVWCVKREKTFLTREENIAGGWHYIYPAPLACEILDVLPDYIVVEKAVFCLLIEKSVSGFHADYVDFTEEGFKVYFKGQQCEADTLADKVAKLSIHLLENNIIKLEDVNR